MSPPFTLSLPRAGTVSPFVMASPHSGRDYPREFLNMLACRERDLRRAEDAWTDRLYDPASRAVAAPLLKARYGRTFVDLNRDPAELDPEVIADLPPRLLSERVKAGLGVIPRVATPGVPLYREPLSRLSAEARLRAVHAPYHARLHELLAAARQANGAALLIDCHSMPSLPPARGKPAPQVIIGTRLGKSCAPWVRDVLVNAFSAHAEVAVDRIYAGGWTTAHHGRPDDGIEAVQIEIDRALYLDPETLLPSDEFASTAAMIEAALGTLAAAWYARRPGLLAAE
ncbi:MAG: N-formylglutamate amidohydrolase [Pacificimonas sp.]|jgi:N-formylglutamate amidohydrolase|nr:N-formylglutamate amidohydrolase [Pacificimonas sp.]